MILALASLNSFAYRKIKLISAVVTIVVGFCSQTTLAVTIAKIAKIQVAGTVVFQANKTFSYSVIGWKAVRYFIDETSGAVSYASDTSTASGDAAQFTLLKTSGKYSYYKIFAYEGNQTDSVVIQTLTAGIVQKYLYTNLSLSQYSVPVWVVLPTNYSYTSKFITTMCGINRDASNLASYWAPFANANNYIVAAPEFNATDWSSDDYILGNMFTGASGSGNLNPKDKWSFNIVEQIHRELFVSCGLADSMYELWGHSAGAQFVHRLACFLPDNLVSRYIAGNSGWYTCPDLSVAFPWGAQHNLLNLTSDNLITFTNQNLVIMRGTADTIRDGALNTEPNSDAQGLNRYTRAGFFYNKGVIANSNLKWKLIDVLNVGHSDQDMAVAGGNYILANQVGLTQPITAGWPLTSDGTPSLVGNISASSVVPSTSTNITGFAGYSFNSTSPAGLKLGATGATSWPADGSTTTANSAFTGLSNGTTRYVQFSVSPTTGNNLQITNISMQVCQNAIAATMNVAVGYSIDGINFTTFNSGGLNGNALSATGGVWSTYSATPSLTVGSTGAVIVRMIIWRKANSSASSTAVIIGNVILSGTTTPIPVPTIQLNTNGILSFGVTPVGSSSSSQSFLVNGTNLTNNLIISPPAGFEIRTGSNAFSTSSIILTPTNGFVSSTSIDVRFTPLALASYSEDIVCSSSGANAQDVAITGAVPVFYSKSSGSPDALATWTTDVYGGSGFAPANFTTAGQYFYIQNNPSASLGANWTVSGANSKVVVGNGVSPCSFTIPSAYTFSSPATEITCNSNLILKNISSVSTLGLLIVDSAGTYQHDCDGGIQLNGTFVKGSTLKVTGVTASNVWLPQICSNVVWNCPSQTANGKFYNIDGALSINGSLTIISTGTGYCAVNTSSAIRTLSISGNLNVQAGSFRLLGASSGSGATTLSIAGNVNVNGTGTLNLSSTSNVSPASTNIYVQGNFLHTAGSVTKTSSNGTASITFNGIAPQQFSTTGITAPIDVIINNPSFGVMMVDGNPSTSTVSGNLTITAGYLSLGGNAFSFAGSLLTNNGSINGAAVNSVFRFNGNSVQTYSGNGNFISPLYELQLSNSSSGVKLDTSINSISVLSVKFLGTGNLINANKLILGSGNNLVTLSYGVLSGTTTFGNFDKMPTYNLGAGKLNILYLGETTNRVTGFEFPANRIVNYLQCNNFYGLTIAGGGITIQDSLLLRLGNIINSSANQIVLSNGAKIIRESGSLAVPPAFGLIVNLTYSNSDALLTGGELPTATGVLNDLIISNPGGLNKLTLGASAVVNGTLTMIHGILSLGANNLMLSSSASIAGSFSSENMIVPEENGKLIKIISEAQTMPVDYFFPVGSVTESIKYTPVSVTINSGTLTSYSQIGINVVRAKYLNNANTIDYLKYYWNLRDSGITSPSYSIVFTYSPGDVIGTESNLKGAVYNSRWTLLPNVNSILHQINAPNISALGVFTAGAQSGFAGTSATAITVKLLPEGYAANPLSNPTLPVDTFMVHMAIAISPFTDVESHPIQIDASTLSGTAVFTTLPTGQYYLYVTHHNMVETWSKEGGESLTEGMAFGYDFTLAQSQAYNSNMIFRGGLWCMYSGDVDQNGFIDNNDLLLVDNDAYNFASGLVSTDLDGNQFVDNNDLLICDNNAFNFVGTAKPTAPKFLSKPQIKKNQVIEY